MKVVLSGAALAAALLSTSISAQTVDQDLAQCMLREIEKYQPIDEYRYEPPRCRVGNKKPFKGTPSSGPTPITLKYKGYIFLTASIANTFKISDGGHTPPYITPRRDAVTTAIWCKAEDKLYGAGGEYRIQIFGTRQRVATDTERRRALTECSKQMQGRF